jgi:hypothetical protein
VRLQSLTQKAIALGDSEAVLLINDDKAELREIDRILQ